MTTIPEFNKLPNTQTMTEAEYNDAWNTTHSQLNPWGAAANALGAEVEQNAANAAAAVEGLANAVWVSGSPYTVGQVRYSPIDLLNYRRKTNGAGTIDPSIDTTNWALLTKTSNGGAEQQSSATDITLTSNSLRVQSITMTAALKHVILPAPGTLQTGLVFVVKNSGNYRFGIRNNAGKLIARVDVGAVVVLSLVDTVTDKWAAMSNSQSTATAVAGLMEVVNAATSSVFRVTRLSDTTALAAYWNGSNAKLVHLTDELDGTVTAGTPVTVTGTSSNSFDIVALSATEAVFVHRVGTATQSIVITVSGTVPSIGGSPGTIDASSSVTSMKLIKVSATRAHVVYVVSVNIYARVIDIGGGITSPGSQSGSKSATAGEISKCAISETQVMVTFKASSGTIKTIIYNISGTTTTPATEFTTATVTTVNYHVTLLINATTGVVIYDSSSTGADKDLTISLFDIAGSSLSNLRKRKLEPKFASFLSGSILNDGRILLLGSGYPAGQGVDVCVLRYDGNQLLVDGHAALGDLYAQSGEIVHVVLSDNRVMCVRKSPDGYAGAFLTEVAES